MSEGIDRRRREVAAELRYRSLDGVANPLAELKEVVSCDGTWRDLYRELAVLVDRPSTRAVLCHDGFYGCTRCGYDGWAGAEDVTRFCPECGAEVVGQ